MRRGGLLLRGRVEGDVDMQGAADEKLAVRGVLRHEATWDNSS